MVRQLVKQLVYNSLLLIITIRFIYGEREICSTVKKSQNIMNMEWFHHRKSLTRREWAGTEPTQNLTSDLVEWTYAKPEFRFSWMNLRKM